METYFYVNIFETKGLEYLLLLAFLVLLVLLFRYIRSPAATKRVRPSSNTIPAPRRAR